MKTTRYLIRALKAILLFFIIAFLMFLISFCLGVSSNNPISFMELIYATDVSKLVIFFFAFGLIYPFIGYSTQKVYLNRSFEEDKQEIIRLFSEFRFILEKDEEQKMIFRHKNPVARFMRLCEDRITLDYSQNPLEINGLRRDADRLVRLAQRVAQKEESGV